MASAKLIKIQSHIHPNGHQIHKPIAAYRHLQHHKDSQNHGADVSLSPYNRLSEKTISEDFENPSLDSKVSVIASPSHSSAGESPVMTLDYSLPRGRELEVDSPPRHDIEAWDHDSNYTHQVTRRLAESRDNTCSPPSQRPDSPEDRESLSEAATRKNKRKLSSPRRRTDNPENDNAVTPTKKKKLVLDLEHSASPAGEDDDSGIDSYKSIDDTIIDVVNGADCEPMDIPPSPKYTQSETLTGQDLTVNKHRKRKTTHKSIKTHHAPGSPDSSMVHTKPPKKQQSSKHISRRSLSPPISSNTRDETLNQHNPPSSSSTQPHLPSHIPMHPGIPPNFIYPMLAPSDVSSAALGLVPGMYFPGSQFGNFPPGLLHSSIAMLPPHLQHAYITAAAAAQAQASRLIPSTEPTTSPSSSSTRHSTTTSSEPSITSSSNVLYNKPGYPSLPPMFYPGIPQPSRTAETTVTDSKYKHLPSVSTSSSSPSIPPQSTSSTSKSTGKSSKGKHRQKRRSISSASSSASPLPHTPAPVSSSSPKLQPTEIPSTPFPVLHPHTFKPTSPYPDHNQNAMLTSNALEVEDGNDSSSSRPGSPEDLSLPGGSSDRMSRKHRKNYKNMTRERRVEANARERTRVHTISAAFDALRRAVPSYSHNQKLSKLAILRIACSYIMSLARLGDMDYTSAIENIGKPLGFDECVEMTTNTIQTEGRARRRH